MAIQSDLTIVKPTPEDAADLIEYMVRLTSEPHNNITADPGQWSMTVEKERQFIERRNGCPEDGIFVIAKSGGRTVAIGQIDRGSRQTNRHSGCLGISVDAAMRRRGIGWAMMQYLLNWADDQRLVRVWLNVFARNTAAIELYRKFGFVEEGRHPYAFCKQGIWVEDLTMARIRGTEKLA